MFLVKEEDEIAIYNDDKVVVDAFTLSSFYYCLHG